MHVKYNIHIIISKMFWLVKEQNTKLTCQFRKVHSAKLR